MDDEAFQAEFRAVKIANKHRLTQLILERLDVSIDPQSMFDIHVKRIHEYKRQLLNVLHAVTRYNRIRQFMDDDILSRTLIFSGKAAPGYEMAKLIIHLINRVADIINNDPSVEGRLKVVFIPNYDVQTADDIIPAADLSQQISMAGTEASGTGNMKLALNGALTIATRDGANNEIADAVGSENIFMFGHVYDELRPLTGRIRATASAPRSTDRPGYTRSGAAWPSGSTKAGTETPGVTTLRCSGSRWPPLGCPGRTTSSTSAASAAAPTRPAT